MKEKIEKAQNDLEREIRLREEEKHTYEGQILHLAEELITEKEGYEVVQKRNKEMERSMQEYEEIKTLLADA